MPNSVLPLRPASLMDISRPSPTQASALPFSRCPVCSHSLTDFYAGAEDLLVIGQCLEHGVWIERGDPAVLEATFAAEIARHATEIASPAEAEPEDVEPPPERVMTSTRTALAPGVAELMKRVSSLERTVEDLYRKLASLRATVDQQK